ncbi:hypothetical protein [Limnobaculum parvum]|uniref:Type VI secretion protein n=1 Tax=Limnobaculum parvum TaxID=2172103 RepID=A0A2Y9TUL5_9GAMM|nr:hypothetical protein [Limnobaculum parvum]AWH87249.1 hypothetical protein HYN51_00950 [Limnobaculum parvum]
MPVVLSLIPAKKEASKPPGLLAWGLLFLLALSIGFILTAFFFSPEGRERNLWFWLQAVLLPTVIWLLLFCVRFLFYDHSVKYTTSWNKHHDNRRNELIEFAQRPLIVVSQSIMTGAGCFGHATAITNNLLKIASTKPVNGEIPIPHSSIKKDNSFDSAIAMLSHVFTHLKNDLKLPEQGEFKKNGVRVKLDIDCELNQQEILKVWETIWKACLPEEVNVEFVAKQEGVMLLDEWLDDLRNDYGYLLVISVQLHEQAQKNSAEAAIAMLFSGINLNQPDDKLMTYVHRPVQGDITSSLNDAVLWGKNEATEVEGIWSSEGEQAYLPDMLIAFNQMAGTTPDIYRINAALGYAGIAAGWLTLTIAIEQSKISKRPQLVSYSDHRNVFMMVKSSSRV